MNITKMHIAGFGAVRDRKLAPGGGLTVLYGPNEAGKSSALYFIRAMLYGFPGRQMPAQRGEPATGGPHGGELSALDRDGNVWTVRRFAGSTEGGTSGGRERLSVTVDDGSGEIREASQSELERVLLGGVSSHMFSQLFALSLSELQELRSLQSEEMNRYLFHAGIGGGSGIIRAERRLAQEMDKLYKPRGRVQESAKIIQSIGQLRGGLAEGRSYLPKYNEAVAGLKEIEAELARLEERRSASSEELQLLRKAAEIRPVWLAWKEHRLELSALPEGGVFPLNGLKRWEVLQEESRAVSLGLAKAERSLETLDARLEGLPVHEALEAHGLVIDELWSRHPLMEERRRETRKLREDRRLLAERLSIILQSIDPSWKAEQLSDFRVSAAEREDIRRMGASFAGYDRRMEALSHERRSAQKALAAAEADLKEARRSLQEEQGKGESHFYMIKPEAPRETLALWGRLQLEADRWREARLARSQAGPSPVVENGRAAGMPALYTKLLTGMSLLTVLLPGALLAADSYTAAGAAAVLLLAADGYVWWSGRKEASASRSGVPKEAGAESDEGAEVARLFSVLIEDPYAAPAGEAGLPRGRGQAGRSAGHDPVLLESRLRETRKLMEEWQGWHHRLQRLEAEAASAEDRVSQQETELRHIERVLEQEAKRFAELEGQWEAWLEGKQLPVSLSPEGVVDILASAEQGNELLRQMKSLDAKISLLDREEAEYAAACQELCRVTGIISTVGSENHDENGRSMSRTGMGADHKADAISSLAELYRKWERYREGMSERKHLLERKAELQREQSELKQEMAGLMEQEKELLLSAKARDEETYLRRGMAVVRREELLQEIRRAEIAMFSGWDESSRKRLEALLENMDQPMLDSACRDKEADLAGDDELRDELRERKGRLLQEKENLGRKGAEEDTLQQLEEQQAALKEIVSEYAIRSIGAELIRQTRKIYEEEKQPHVLKLASGYFSRLTGGKYARVLMRMEDQMLLAAESGGTLVESVRLSRGTAEQLYFAMRLALVELMTGEDGLPLVLDDIFVNFDRVRLQHALEVLRDVSDARQVMLLTCHEHVASMIHELHPSAKLITM